MTFTIPYYTSKSIFTYSISISVSQNFIGQQDVKTKTVHFYAQRNSTFSTGGIIPFELARLNEESAFNLISGIFTVPVPGIYHFDFSTLKENTANYLGIYLRVNDANVGYAYTWQSATGSQDVVSLSASLRLAKGDTVNLYNAGSGSVLLDNGNHHTHFSGWLVEEDLT